MIDYLEVPLNCESWVNEERLIIVSIVDEVVAKLNLGILNVAEIEMEQPIECDDNVMAQDIAALAIFAHIKKIAGSDLRLNSLNHFGRTL